MVVGSVLLAGEHASNCTAWDFFESITKGHVLIGVIQGSPLLAHRAGGDLDTMGAPSFL